MRELQKDRDVYLRIGSLITIPLVGVRIDMSLSSDIQLFNPVANSWPTILPAPALYCPYLEMINGIDAATNFWEGVP
jgi:hypothetical protein